MICYVDVLILSNIRTDVYSSIKQQGIKSLPTMFRQNIIMVDRNIRIIETELATQSYERLYPK